MDSQKSAASIANPRNHTLQGTNLYMEHLLLATEDADYVNVHSQPQIFGRSLTHGSQLNQFLM